MEVLNYDQTLELVESFMEKSGIRSYCTDICKGDCCGSCYTNNPEACHRNEGRRLACSVYLCYTPTCFPTDDFMEPFVRVSREVTNVIDRVYERFDTNQNVYSSGFAIYRNKYFRVPPKELFSNFEIPKVVVTDNLTAKFAAEVRKYIDMIIRYINKVEDKEEYIRLRLTRFKLECNHGKWTVYDPWIEGYH